LFAKTVPFGCFILDPSGSSVASVVFSSGSIDSLTVSFSQNGDLGVIIVDLTSGLAQVILPAGGAPVTSAPGACPLGTWTALLEGFTSSCGGVAEAMLWMVQQPSGQYLASYTVLSTGGDAGVACYGQSESGLPATYANGVVTFVVHDKNSMNCDARRTVTFTPDLQCHSTAGSATRTTCGTCETTGQCNGCGTATCVVNFTATRD